MSVTVLVNMVSSHPHQLKGVTNYEDLKKKGCQKLGLDVELFGKMTIEGEELEPATFEQNQLSPGKVIVFWPKLDRVKDLLGVSLNSVGLAGTDEAIGVYNFLEMQLGGNLSDKREGDEKWFTGLKHDWVSKSAYMKGKASSRIFNYYNMIREALNEMKDEYDEASNVLSKFSTELKKKNWECAIFGRGNNDGKFKCLGPYNKKDCPFCHIINPYRTLHGRLQFSAWELDHCIEKSFVIKELEKAIMNNPDGRGINTQYFYNLMFTTDNLKLVNNACHDKGRRDDFNEEKFDGNQVYV